MKAAHSAGGDVALIGVLARYFFRAGPEATAAVGADVQAATVVVQGGYQPNAIRALRSDRAGTLEG